MNTLFMTILLSLSNAQAGKGTGCNQAIYDATYRQIVNNAYADPRREKHLPQVMKERNAAIRMLRSLCNGQLSSYERAPVE